MDNRTSTLSQHPHHAQRQELLHQPLLARLATANPHTLQPHVVPVWFLWDGESLWISAFSSTRKLRDVQRNPRIAVLVEPPPGSSGLQAVLLEGAAELITSPRSRVAELAERIYTHYLGEQGVLAAEPQSWIHDPENTIIRLVPQKIYSW